MTAIATRREIDMDAEHRAALRDHLGSARSCSASVAIAAFDRLDRYEDALGSLEHEVDRIDALLDAHGVQEKGDDGLYLGVFRRIEILLDSAKSEVERLDRRGGVLANRVQGLELLLRLLDENPTFSLRVACERAGVNYQTYVVERRQA